MAPAVAELFDSMSMPADPGLTLTAYSAEPGTRSENALKLLASWAATQPAPTATADEADRHSV